MREGGEALLKIIVQEDCGNSPRKVILRDFVIAMVEKDSQTILASVDENMTYEQIGKTVIQGSDQFLSNVEAHKEDEVRELELLTIITHAKTAAVNGKAVNMDGQEYHFATIYRFTGNTKTARIKEITNYLVITLG